MGVSFGIRYKKHLIMRVLQVLCNVSLYFQALALHTMYNILRLTAAAFVLRTGSTSLLQVL